MNTEKIEKLKKSLSNTKIPADLKPKIEAEIKRLESLDAKQEVKEEAKEEAKEVVAKKPRAKRVATKKATAKPSQTRKPKRTAMSLAKEIRKEGESWNDARARASKMMKEETKTVSKKVETELDKLSKLVKNQKTRSKLVGISGTDIRRDASRKAKPRGARTVTRSGETSNQHGTYKNHLGRKYYESRDKHSDRLAPNYPKNAPLLENGAYLTDPTFGTFQNQVYAKGGGVRKVGNREYSYGRNWTNDFRHVNKDEEHEVNYKRKGKFLGIFNKGGGVGDYEVKLLVGKKVVYQNNVDTLKKAQRIASEILSWEDDGFEYTIVGYDSSNNKIFENKRLVPDEFPNKFKDKFSTLQLNVIVANPKQNKLDAGSFTTYKSLLNIVDDFEEGNFRVTINGKTFDEDDYELGGTVVVDLAGHTGAGDGGLNAGVPLDGVSGTNYNGLVGETGAMSSGEMFMAGGKVKFVEDFSNGDGIQVSKDKTEDGKTFYTAFVTSYPFRKVVPMNEDKDYVVKRAKKIYSDMLEYKKNEKYELGGGLPSGAEQSYMVTEALGNPAQHLNKGGSVTNERLHVNHNEDYEVRYAKPRPHRKGYKGVRGFETGGNVDSKKQQLKKGDVVIITGRRWFDKANGNTYHTAMVNVNGQSYGKSPITYGYEEQYMQTGKEILLKYFNLPKGMKETSPLWQLREYGVQLINFVNDGLKRDLEDGGDFQSGVYANGGGVRTINGREYSYGRNWTNDHDHVNKGEEHEVNYRSKKSFFKDGGKVYANGGGVDEPSIYVADLEAYNNGKLVGEWLNLTDYNDADELMDAIRDVLKKSGGEEYAIHDVENIPSSMYSEYMGKSDFKQLYDMIDLSKEQDLPLPVVQDIVSQYDASAVYEFVGKYDSADDFAQQLVDDIGGIQNFYNFERYLTVSETDRRLLAQENADMYVDDVSYEDGGNRIVEEADLDLEEYEEADSERQEEMVNEAKEIVYDRLYNEWYDGLNDPYYFLVEEQGIYDAESFANANFVQVDYEDLGDALEDDYAYIYYNSDLYVFNVR